jgi:hypothetical protein
VVPYKGAVHGAVKKRADARCFVLRGTNFIKPFSALLICVLALAGGSPAGAAYYEITESRALTKGAEILESLRVVDGGLLDVYIMKIPAGGGHITLAPVNSPEYGLKETTARLLENAGAIAGVNGDYFGLAGDYSVPLGLEINGARRSFTDNAGQAANKAAASFLIGSGGLPFMGFVTTEISLWLNGEEVIPVNSLNKTVAGQYPVILTPEAFSDTSGLDGRSPGLVKLLVSNDKLTYISAKGETVSIPKDGFAVLLSGADYDKYKSKISAGQRAVCATKASVDINGVSAAISGGGMIVSGGKVSLSGNTVTPDARQPRTAVGITGDRKTVMLAVIDGRNHSVGATAEEAAKIMIEYGAHTAMLLDGGGSSTMYARGEVVNTPSEGAERRVINALGVFENAPESPVTSIGIKGGDVQVPGTLSLEAAGYDDYLRETDISAEAVFSAETALTDGASVIANPGVNKIKLEYKGLTAEKSVRVIDVTEIIPSKESIITYEGAKTPFSLAALDSLGYSAPLPPNRVSFAVFPDGLGVVADGAFTALKPGKGYISCSFGAAAAYIPVDAAIGAFPAQSFDSLGGLSASAYPSSASAHAELAAEEKTAGSASLKLSYKFGPSSGTQAAYLNFDNFKGYSLGYRLSVYGGEADGLWLRGKVTDASGASFSIDFAQSIDWDGWREAEAWLPAGAVQPVTLNQIYAVSLSEGRGAGGWLLLDDLRIFVQTPPGPDADVPLNTSARDPLTADFAGADGYDLTFIGSLKGRDGEPPPGYAENRAKAAAALADGSKGAFYLQYDDISPETGTKTYYLKDPGKPYIVNDVTVIPLSGAPGGFARANAAQYANLKNSALYAATPTVVVITDANPLKFKYKKEYDVFHSIVKAAREAGKTVFVVSSEGTAATGALRDEVRYINMGALYGENGVNAAFSVLRLRVSPSGVKYGFNGIFQ